MSPTPVLRGTYTREVHPFLVIKNKQMVEEDGYIPRWDPGRAIREQTRALRLVMGGLVSCSSRDHINLTLLTEERDA